MGRKYTDNAVTTLSTSITNVSTTLAVPGAMGGLFPAVTGAGTPGFATDYFVITLEDNSNNIEKIKVETRIVDQMGSGGYPLIRGFDGTTARSWPSGSLVELRWERSAIANLVGKDERDVKGGDLVMAVGRIEADRATAVVAAATTDLGPVAGNFVVVTHASGTLAITSFGGATAAQSGTEIEIQFQVSGGALSITNSASLQCLGADVAIENGDMLRVRKVSDAAADWRVMSYTRANGLPARPSVNKNRHCNGDFRFDQRNSGIPPTINSGAEFRCQDCWTAFGRASGGSFTVTTFAPAGGAVGGTNYSRIQVAITDAPTPGTAYVYRALIEGLDIADLGWSSVGAKPVSLSFWFRSSLTGTFSGSLLNAGIDRSYAYSWVYSVANVWQKVEIPNIPGDITGTWVANNNRALHVNFCLGSNGGLGTAGSWQAATLLGVTGSPNVMATLNATYDLAQVQLEAGPVCTPFDWQPYQEALARVQRYFCKTFAVLTPLGTNTSNGWLGGFNNQSGVAFLVWQFPVSMRASPTVTYQANGSGALWYDSVGGFIMTPSTARINEGRAVIALVGGNAGAEFGGHAFAAVEL